MDRLPLELISHVLDNLVPDFEPQEPSSSERATLRAGCLVNSTWRAKLQPALFVLVGGSRSPRQLELLADAIDKRPVLGTFVYELQIGDLKDWDAESSVGDTLDLLLRSCPGVRDISMHFTQNLTVPLNAIFTSPKLKELSLVGGVRLTGPLDTTKSPGYTSLVKLNVDIDECPASSVVLATLVRAPNVRTLGLGTDRYMGDTFEALTGLFDFNLGKVTYLDVSRVTDLDLDWEDIIPTFSALETFSIDLSHVDILHVPNLPRSISSLRIDLSGSTPEGLSLMSEVSAILCEVLKPPKVLPSLRTIRFTDPTIDLAKLVQVSLITPEVVQLCKDRGVKLDARPPSTRATENDI